MQVIALAAEKGGTGKSTITVHLAVCAVRRRKRVAVVDLDPQRSVFDWGTARTKYKKRHPAAGLVDVPIFDARPQELPGMLERANAQGVDLVILDTAGRADVTASRAIGLADVVLVPCRPARYDLDASVGIAKEIKAAKVKRAAFVLSAVPRGKVRATQAREALEGLLPVCPVELHQYAAFVDALNDGRSVEELEADGKAAEEIRSLYKWICGGGR